MADSTGGGELEKGETSSEFSVSIPGKIEKITFSLNYESKNPKDYEPKKTK